MKVAITGDWHIGAVVSGYDTLSDLEIYQEIINATNNFDLLVIMGDLFHRSKPTPEAYANAIDLLNGIACQWILFPGNHDMGKGGFTRINKDGDPVLSFDALEPLRRMIFESEGKVLSVPGFYDHVHDEHVYKLMVASHITDALAKKEFGKDAQQVINGLFVQANEVGPDLCFCHLDVEGAQFGTEGSFMVGGTLRMPFHLAQKLNCRVFNGHIHKRQSIGNIEMPGSLIPTDFGDRDGTKGYLMIEV